jgi:hypothetical protein
VATGSPHPPSPGHPSQPRDEGDIARRPAEAEPEGPSFDVAIAGLEPAPKPQILFLDDDPLRAEIFLERYPEAVWVQTSEDCIGRLAHAWDEVHLDHDLGGERYVDPDRNDCGMEVVRWLCAELRESHRETRFLIHSHNVEAARTMVENLRQTGYDACYRPFAIDLDDFITVEDMRALFREARASRRWFGCPERLRRMYQALRSSPLFRRWLPQAEESGTAPASPGPPAPQGEPSFRDQD